MHEVLKCTRYDNIDFAYLSEKFLDGVFEGGNCTMPWDLFFKSVQNIVKMLLKVKVIEVESNSDFSTQQHVID